MGFPHSSVGKESACNAGDLGWIPRLGRAPGEGNGTPLQYSCLENPMDRGAWRAAAYGAARVGHDWAAQPPPGPRLTQRAMYYCNRLIILFTQIINKKQAENEEKNFSLTLSALKSAVNLVHRGWHWVNRQEELLTERGREVERWQSWSCVPLFATPWTVAHQAPLSMGFSRQEYWCGVPLPTPGGSSWPRDRTYVSFFLLHWQADSSTNWQAQGWRIFSNRRWRASCNFTHAWCW